MNALDLEQKIARYKARKAKLRLSRYNALISLLLALSVFGQGFSLPRLLTALLILPLPLYFFLNTAKLARKLRLQKTKLSEQNDLVMVRPTRFSLAKFLTQPSLSFRFSLLLFILVIFTTLARIETPDPTLTMNQPSTINH